ncbi:MAG: hypothetical protein JWN03_272 [Nocardia sp.]|uniref:hypothetical protein n=1 Tax=Nocardia sp. TaxID=1821 RepID=UPI0026387D69|nr:hypothetical protein [Nocardia sp.]MCU1639997.1 hypothetical protein [Nocardia sp.]
MNLTEWAGSQGDAIPDRLLLVCGATVPVAAMRMNQRSVLVDPDAVTSMAGGVSLCAEWRQEWDAVRMFLTADGETGKAGGNETIRVTPATGATADQSSRCPG